MCCGLKGLLICDLDMRGCIAGPGDFRGDGRQREAVAGEERGRGERSRSHLLFKQAGTESMLILVVDVLVVKVVI